MPVMAKLTPISEINNDELHLVRSKILQDLTVTGPLITETLRKIDEYAGNVPYGVITDSSEAGFPSVTRDAFAAAKEVSPHPHFKAHALLVTQTGIRLIVNFFLRTFPMAIPIKMFDTDKEAAFWVRTETLKASENYIFTIHVVISGKVQGVFYRNTCEQKANELGVVGTVKNVDNGDVEIVAKANGKSLIEFIHWCKKGPAKAKVKDVVFSFLPDDSSFSSFRVLR